MDDNLVPVLTQEKQVENRNPDGTFIQGVSGNPNGRPKKNWTWADLFIDMAEEMRDTKLGKLQVKKIIAKRLFAMAMGGDIQAIKEVIDRMEGKAMQQHDVNHSGEVTLSFHTSLKQDGIKTIQST